MIDLLIVLFAAAVVAVSVGRVGSLLRARNRHSLSRFLHGPAGDASAAVGFSLLCSGVCRSGQIENLLAAEYARCEVIVVADAWYRRVFFESLVARYRMIRVDYLPSDEFLVQGVRSMWRSRRRCFRRLVLLDRPEDTEAGDFDAAASVAAYDWLIPVRRGQYLLPGALDRLAVEVGRGSAGAPDMLRSRVGEPFCLFGREAVAAAGGFGAHPARRIPRARCRKVREPFFYRSEFSAGRGRWRPWAAWLLAGAVVAAGWTGHWALAAGLLTVAVGWSAGACARLLTESMAGRAIRCKFSVKNFTDR